MCGTFISLVILSLLERDEPTLEQENTIRMDCRLQREGLPGLQNTTASIPGASLTELHADATTPDSPHIFARLQVLRFTSGPGLCVRLHACVHAYLASFLHLNSFLFHF